MLRRVALVSVLLLVFTCVAISRVRGTPEQPINLMLTALPAGKDPQRYQGYVTPKYKEAVERSLYLNMRDGVKIAVTIVMPKDLPSGEKIPAIMNMTRYWRAHQGRMPFLAGAALMSTGDDGVRKPQPFVVLHGYATVFVDARGTGASFGVWRAPWSQDEIKDYDEVVNWIVGQSWSNGKVGAYGNSYEGNTAQWLAVTLNPAVKAVIPLHYEFDEYLDTPYPGGILTDWLVKTWNEGNRELDTNSGVKLVDEDADQHLYREAIKHRADNVDVYKLALKTTFRDDLDPSSGVSLDDVSIHTYRRQIEQSRVAINNWGGWLDASTADGVIRSFVTFSNYQRAIVGPWNHGGGQNASPYMTPDSLRVMKSFEGLRFFDHYLKGIDTGLDVEKRLYYFTMGEEKWKVTAEWPVAGTKSVRWYLNESNSLSSGAPESASGEDRYKVNFDATTGEKNRWRTQVTGDPVVYPDRADEDKKLLAYTSAPLAADTEITGYPVVDLFISSTHTDGAFYVYLEDIDENGKVTYLTEGELRALHRKISNDPPPYKIFVPYHSFKKKDATPLVPSQIAELKFGLLPTSVLIKKGHRLRVAIAGHDKSVFARLPAEGAPTITVARNKRNASWIELPIVERGPHHERK